MKKTGVILGCLTMLIQLVNAQSKQQASANFIGELNSVLKSSPTHHWAYKGAMTIDSFFTIDPSGVLSVTVRYTNEDSSFLRVRMEAPVRKLKWVAYDLFLILECDGDYVTVYESKDNRKELKLASKTNLFHIGEPAGDGYWYKEQLQKLLNNLLKYYVK